MTDLNLILSAIQVVDKQIKNILDAQLLTNDPAIKDRELTYLISRHTELANKYRDELQNQALK